MPFKGADPRFGNVSESISGESPLVTSVCTQSNSHHSFGNSSIWEVFKVSRVVKIQSIAELGGGGPEKIC